MRKKVIDIYPPCKEENKKSTCKEKREPKKCKKGLFFTIFFIFLALGAYFYYNSYRTEVKIYLEAEDFQIEEGFLVKSAGVLEDRQVRGVVLRENVSDNRDFPVERMELVEEKTVGEIKVCQEYSDSQVNYVEETRFISEEGKVFFATERVVLPPRNENDGCGFVEVIASKPGEEYNIDSDSQFALPGLDGTALYGSVKGVSFDIKKEGTSKEVPYLDESTKRAAKEQMREELFKKGKEALLKEYGEDYFIENDSQYKAEIVKQEIKEDEENSEKFYFKLEVDVKVMAISKEEVLNFIKEAIPEGRDWRRETQELTVSFSRINFEEGIADAFIDFSAQIHEEVPKEDWKRKISGLEFEQAKNKLEKEIDAQKIEISTRPFGLSRVSENPERVEFVLKFDY